MKLLDSAAIQAGNSLPFLTFTFIFFHSAEPLLLTGMAVEGPQLLFILLVLRNPLVTTVLLSVAIVAQRACNSGDRKALQSKPGDWLCRGLHQSPSLILCPQPFSLFLTLFYFCFVLLEK